MPFLFAVAIWTNSELISRTNIETFIVLRCTTPLLVAMCDFLVMGKSLPTPRSLVCFSLVIGGSIVYALTDEGFSLESYAWAGAYLLTIVTEMIVVKHVFTTVQMTTAGRVLYNNALSLPFQPLFVAITHEQDKWAELEWTPTAIVFLSVSSVVGLSLAYSGTGFRARVSATTFTLLGVVNKIISVVINYFMWDKHANEYGLAALAVCLVGSTLYQPAQSREAGSWSESVWGACNKCSCGLIAYLELETAEHSAAADEKAAMEAAKVAMDGNGLESTDDADNDAELERQGLMADVEMAERRPERKEGET